MRNQNGNAVVGLPILICSTAAVFGWAWNIVKICDSDFSHITGMLIVRIIGIFIAPIGAVLGYF